jgi:allantoin racemase
VAIPIIERNIRAMGLWPRCAGVRASGVPVLALGARRAEVRAAIDATLAADPQLAIVLGCGGMSVLAEDLRPEQPCRLVDPVRAAAAMALAATAALV